MVMWMMRTTWVNPHTAEHVVRVGSNPAALSQLTDLQALSLRDVQRLDLGLLAGMHNLHSLQLAV